MAKFVTLHAILQKLVEAARNKPETTGKLVTFILKNEKKLKPLVKASALAATDLVAATEVLKKVNDITGGTMNKVDKFAFDNANKAISILQDATSITNLLTGGRTKSGAGKVFRQIEKFVNPGQIMLEQMKGKINMANKIRNKLFGPNDLSWYGHYPELNQAMIGPNFYNIVGTPLQFSGKNTFKYSVPLGMSLDIALTVPSKADITSMTVTGAERFDNSSFKNAVNRIYASIRRANSGAINYTTKDLTLFIINFRSLIAEYVQWGRLYGTLIKYKLINKTVPELFYTMIGVGKSYIQDYENNAANMFNKLTQWRLKLNSLCPIDLDLFKRTEWLFTGYWKDDSSSKAQYFAFKSIYLPKYVYGDSASDIGIVTKCMENGFNKSFVDACKTMEEDIDNFATNVNVIIAGDMLKAFSDVGLKQYILPKYELNYEAPEAYNEEALTIIQNSSTTPWPNASVSLIWRNDTLATDIHCASMDASALPFAGYSMLERYINAYKGIRNVISDNKVTLAITRLMTTYYSAEVGGQVTGMAVDVGTEVVIKSHFYYFNQYHNLKEIEYFDYKLYDTTSDPTEYFLLNYCWAGTDWAPYLKPMISINVNGNTVRLNPLPLFDWEVYGTVDSQQLQSYNDIVTMNLFYVPDVIKPNRVELMVNVNKTGKSEFKGKREPKDKKEA